jgi:hypothetical protein
MPHVLVVSQDAKGFPSGQRLGDVVFSRYARAEEAIHALPTEPAALLVLDRLTADVRTLELLAGVKALRPNLPILVLLPDGADFPLPSGLHPCLRFSPTRSKDRERLSAEIRFSLVNAASRRRRSELRLVDFLAVAVALRQSIDLHVQHANGASSLFNVVEGSLWNAYSGDLEGEPAVAAEIFASAFTAEVIGQRSLPTHRTIGRPGPEVLRDAARHAFGDVLDETASSHETRPLIVPSALFLQALMKV